MTEKDIKQIPKYILEKIRRKDKQCCPKQKGALRFYAYLAIWHKELVKVTVAVRNYRKQWYCKQVAVHGVNTEQCYVKDMEYCFYAGRGFQVGWYEQGLQRYRKWYEHPDWGWADNKYFDSYAPVVNQEIISKLPKYRFSAYQLYTGKDIIRYLRIYEKYPQAEYLLKLGLNKYAERVTILRKIGKDKAFCKWLLKNRQELNDNYFYIPAILRAYRRHTSLTHEQLRQELSIKDKHGDFDTFKSIVGEGYDEICRYVINQQTNMNSYIDYFHACQYLNLDMEVPKNRFPHDFKRWHDIRIDEYATAKAMKDATQRKELYAKFSIVAEKYLPLQYEKKSAFVVLIPRSPADLIREGTILHHCVGTRNYDQKMIREESLIFFVRDSNKPDIPLVTLEYSPAKHKILQCYGDKDLPPNGRIVEFVNHKWLPYANSTIQKIIA